MFQNIVMQMRKGNCEKGYWLRINWNKFSKPVTKHSQRKPKKVTYFETKLKTAPLQEMRC